nr:MAG TPA: hypothetical protein [Caudoviricetes sp.]
MFFINIICFFRVIKLLIDLINFDVAGSVDTFCELCSWSEVFKRFKGFLICGELLREGAAAAVLVAHVDEYHESRRCALDFVAIFARCCGLNKYPCGEGVCYNRIVNCHNFIIFCRFYNMEI